MIVDKDADADADAITQRLEGNNDDGMMLCTYNLFKSTPNC